VRIDQFVPSFVRHDAISNHVLQARRALREAGYASDIFYEAADPRVAGEGRPFQECPLEADPDRVIVYHASTSSVMAPWLENAALGGQVVALDYHNITPPRYFARWEPAAAASMRKARSELARLVPLAGLAVADSPYNQAELIEMGHPNTDVCPIILDLDEYHQEPDSRTQARLRRDVGDSHLWLFVGRIAPNKCQHDVLAAFAVYRRLFDPGARLALVGAVTSPRYQRSLMAMAAQLGVSDAVELPESTPFPDLLAYFAAADVFVCLSEHEGFCVPIVEAMELGLPVVAYDSSAVTDTVAGGGVLTEDKDPLTVAVAVHQLLSDADRMELVRTAGRSRARDFSLDVSAARMVEVISAWVAPGA
jgi:glycosyltransferase involved in cell wall biosynthesis